MIPRQRSSSAGIALLALVSALALPADPALGKCGDGVLEAGEICDDGNNFGGDGCAANCTDETERVFFIDPERSSGVAQLRAIAVPFRVQGSFVVISGRRGADGRIPLVLRETDLQIMPVQVPGLACVCTRGIEGAIIHGPGNFGSGVVACGGTPLEADTVEVWRDHDTTDEDPQCEMGHLETEEELHPGVCNGFLQFRTSGEAPPGTIGVLAGLSIQVIVDGGTCAVDPDDPAKGPDGVPCTSDDPLPPLSIFDLLVPVASTTIRGAVFDADTVPGADIAAGNMCGSAPCQVEMTGQPYDCDAIEATPNGGLETGAAVLALPVLHNGGIGDALATVRLVALPESEIPTPTPTRPPSPTPTPSLTPPPSPSPTPTISPCPGDCDGNGQVTVAELVLAVNIALGRQGVETCVAADSDRSGEVRVNELISAVAAALQGCPSGQAP